MAEMKWFRVYFTKEATRSYKTFKAARVSTGKGPDEDEGASFWFYDDKDNIVAMCPKVQVTLVQRLFEEE